MFIPLRDHNPLVLIRFPYVNTALIVINVLIFVLFQTGWFFEGETSTPYRYGVIPAVLFDHVDLGPDLAVIPEQLTLITYMFLHGGWMHLISNMLFLYVLGDNIEDALGHVRYLGFYLVCGAAAAFAHALTIPASEAPLIGASGACSGVIAAYMLLFPRVRIWILLLGRIPLPIPAMFAFGFWLALQFFNVFFNFADNVAWWAHIGGFAAGLLLAIILRNKAFPLLGAR